MSANGSTFNLDVDGNHAWELLFDIDNSQNSGSVRRQFEVKTSVSCSFHKMRKDVLNSSAAVSAGLSYGKVVEILNISVKGDMNHEVKYNYETMSESKLEYKTETTKTDVFEIGPNSRLKMYRLVFNGPGINYISDTISSTPHVIDPVHFKFVVREVLFLKGIDVVYTDDSVSRPANVINEVNGKSPDINADNIGLSVGLVPRWTKKFDQAATGIQFVIQSKENSNYINLSRGQIGSYRYIRMELDPHSNSRITKIALYRTKDKKDDPCKDGKWQYKTENINQIYSHESEHLQFKDIIKLAINPIHLIGLVPYLLLSQTFGTPKKDFLYLVWNVAYV